MREKEEIAVALIVALNLYEQKVITFLKNKFVLFTIG